MRSADLLRAILVRDYNSLSLMEKLGLQITHVIERYRDERKANVDDIAFFCGCTKPEAVRVMASLERLGWVRRLDSGEYVVAASFREP